MIANEGYNDHHYDEPDTELISVLELPQLYQKPSPEALLEVLGELTLAPPSWDNVPEHPSRRKINEEGIPAYLTNIVSNPLVWIENGDAKEKIWDAASQRLSERSGRTGRGDLTRTFNVPLGNAIEQFLAIELHEPALQADNLGLKTWASSYLLAKRLTVLRDILPDFQPGARMLELGAGTGLVGLAAAAVFKAHVLLTDLPEIVPNLQRNVASNFDMVEAHGGTTEASMLDWSKPSDFALASGPNTFTLILAADPIYSPDHPQLLVQAIDYHLSKSNDARVIIELPLREAYADERQDLKDRMHAIGLATLADGEEGGFDDWSKGGERAEVRCWWSIWGWHNNI